MRPILAVAMILLAVSTAWPEPEYFSKLPGSAHLGAPASVSLVSASSVDIGSSLGKGNGQAAAPRPRESGAQKSAVPPVNADAAPAANANAAPPANASEPGVAGPPAPLPLGQLCDALMSSAQDNGLPVPFLANLIWQESGLRDDVVSSKGAIGIAQFMPQTAQESGLKNPLDPLQAIPASARLLHDLRAQFGNLGMAAAAYNAGPQRVSDWLSRGRTLPRETRDYVLDITGRSVEQWQKTPPADEELRFVRRLPCRELPAYAELEQAQSRALQAQQQEKSLTAQVAQAAPPQPEKPKAPEPEKAKASEPLARAQSLARVERERAIREAKEHIRERIHEDKERIRGDKGRIREAKEHMRREPHLRHRQA